LRPGSGGSAAWPSPFFAHAVRPPGRSESLCNASLDNGRESSKLARQSQLREPFVRISILAALVFSGLANPSFAQQPEPPALPVGIVLAHRAPVARTAEFVGRVEAIERVEVRARVTGFLESVDFKEGDAVKEGAPLYRIEKDQFKAAVDRRAARWSATRRPRRWPRSICNAPRS
jgi:hypothetical protein